MAELDVLSLSALIGWALYSEGLNVFTVLGAMLILAGNLFNARRRSAAVLDTIC